MRPKKNPYAKPDRFTRAAKDAGYPARSVFKLEEIDRRTRLFRPGMHVLDLGAAPGSWAMYAAQKVFVQGDALALANEELARFAPYDVVLSDMAPRTTGTRVTDQTRSFELFMRALAVAASLGKPGGAFVGKIFMSDDLALARVELRKHYATERLIRPEGTRAGSVELFVVGLERRA